jgi:AraC-like DNA-binding protein
LSQPVSRAELVHAAGEAYASAARLAGANSLSLREAQAGLAKARLIEGTQTADWGVLEAHSTWLGQRGLNYERNLTRLHIGVLLLLRRSPLEARQWLVPLADAALARAGSPLEHDALYFASVACAESGHDRAAWNYMHRYNAGIRDQHLARGTVPPPSLETRIEGAGGRGPSRRRGESEREMVEQVIERVRTAPSARFDSRQLAQFAGVSRRTLENVFRRVTGSAPKEFTTRMRLEEFKRQLRVLHNPTHADLERLARAVGFSSYRVLARCDKRVASAQKKSADFQP